MGFHADNIVGVSGVIPIGWSSFEERLSQKEFRLVNEIMKWKYYI